MIEIGQPTLESQCAGAAEPILGWLCDPEVTDIWIHGTGSAYQDRGRGIEPVPNPFGTTIEVMAFLERLMTPLGRRLDAARPYADGTLADGSRFHVILPPLADPGPALSIRKFRKSEHARLDSFGPRHFVETVRQWVLQKRCFLIAGATGAGKTTLLSRALDEACPKERIVLVEECPEIHTVLPHVVRLVARSATPEGRGEISLRDLVRNSLRMRPDRIIVGECRGEEAVDFLQAMSTGHLGCMGTLHAQGCRDALQRLETLVLLSVPNLDRHAVKQWVSSAVQGVVHIVREGASRTIREMVEVRGWEQDHYRLLPIEPLEPQLSRG